MNKFKILALALPLTWLAACESDPSTTNQDSIVESTASSNFDPAKSVIPFPNDLLFAGTVDGTINIPGATLSAPQIAINALDGFSTTAPITTGFTGAIQASSINGNSIKLFEVTLSSAPGGAAVAINSQLTYGVDYVGAVSSVDITGSSLAILPLKPLKASSAYYVVITNSLKSSDGNPMSMSGAYAFTKLTSPLQVGGVSQAAGLTDAQAVALEPLRALYSTSETTLASSATPLPQADVILSWLFSTQSIGNVLNATKALTGAPTATLTAFGVDIFGTGAGKSPLGAANIHTGTINFPYYLTAPSAGDPTANLTKPWQSANAVGGENNLTAVNPTPAATNLALTIPIMVTTPVDIGTFPTPWKTVIYQHGITTDRTTMLAVSDAMALAGFAVVAIDMPLHGVKSTSPFYSLGNERTFDVDFATQDASGNITAVAADGTVDSSGLHYINLANFLVQRDNLKQSVVDLFALKAAIPGINVDGGTKLDNAEVYFLGHSLGAMVGTTFVALDTDVKDAVFAFGGGSLPKILDGSKSFSPAIVAGLAASGVIKGTSNYESFFGAAQTAIDSVDPVNYAETLAAKTQGILFFEMVGGNSSPSDLVVPNTVPDGNDSSNTVAAPLAGTEPMLRLLGLTQVNSDQAGTNLKHSIKLVVGNHGSLLSAAADASNSEATNTAVRAEIQKMAATFLAIDGGVVDVTDASLLLAP
ncbi:MAG: pimeloyl-ACP methyl ester carboxylesterase [Gammaproteobacteria bacterium]|jgi:pimeloyl-ACP methyl ester carboxylesterase